MSCCGRCGRPFGPGDAVDVSGLKIPAFVRALIAPHLSRLLLNCCSAPECGGLVTGLYLPNTAIVTAGERVTPGAEISAPGVTP